MSDYIPLELISNILARLPIADVLSFRRVCKSWNRLITSSSFISLHFNLSISNTESRVIVRSGTGMNEYCHLHRDNEAFDELEELEPPRNPYANISIYGSSNGVFCCSGYRNVSTIYEESLILWNPSLRKSLILPKSGKSILSKRQQHDVGFGFLPSSDNFKVVRVIYTHNSELIFSVPPEVEIYEFYTRSWRNVNASEFSYVLEHNCGQALLNGIVHWTARDPHRVKGTSTYGGLIVSFDLTSEKFGALMLPNSLQNEEDLYYFCVYTWKESLCLLYTREQSSIFIMKEYGVKDSWEKLLNFDTLDFMPLFLRENGQILAGKLVDGESDKWNLVSCDPKSNEIIVLGVREDAQYFCNAYAYVDSLFLIQDSMKAMENYKISKRVVTILYGFVSVMGYLYNLLAIFDAGAIEQHVDHNLTEIGSDATILNPHLKSLHGNFLSLNGGAYMVLSKCMDQNS